MKARRAVTRGGENLAEVPTCDASSAAVELAVSSVASTRARLLPLHAHLPQKHPLLLLSLKKIEKGSVCVCFVCVRTAMSSSLPPLNELHAVTFLPHPLSSSSLHTCRTPRVHLKRNHHCWNG
jgi:hypothetical protein